MIPSVNQNINSIQNLNNLSTNLAKQQVYNKGLILTQGNKINQNIETNNCQHLKLESNHFNNQNDTDTWLTQISQRHGFNDLESQFVVNQNDHNNFNFNDYNEKTDE